MKSILSYSLLAAAMAAGVATAQTTATTTPVGYTSVECLPGSDTIVGLPLRLNAAAAGALTSTPTSSGGQATLTVANAGFGAFAGTHYVKFKTSSSALGKWFAIASNTADALTVDLNGDTLVASIGDKIEVIKFWTLAELIDPATATDSPATTPNAIVASSNIAAGGRRTELLIPNFSAAGINLSPAVTYFVHGGVWKKASSGNTSFNNDQLWPDSYFIIRNPTSLASSTKYVTSGEVEMNNFTIPLTTRTSSKQDNFIALPRPVDVTLNGLGLGGTSAFESSTNIAAGGRRDELLVFDNTLAARNKAPAVTYFFHGGIWKKASSGNTDYGNDVIKAGSGFIIRKNQSVTGNTAEWSNAAQY